jgi:hypothetical protein
MATPYADFPNARLLWKRPVSAFTSLRDGPAVATEDLVIEGYFLLDGSGGSAANRSTDGRSAGEEGSLMGMLEQPFKGWITRWALVPDGSDWLDLGSGWAWQDSGLRPDRLRPSMDPLTMLFGRLDALPDISRGQVGAATISQVGSVYGSGGVGQLLAEEVGDELRGTFSYRL